MLYKEETKLTFETMGDRSHPAVLLIHGMLCNAESSRAFGKYLADEYFVIMPTLDGHGNDGTDLVSAEEEAEKIFAYLKENGIEKLALLQGSSMGASIALAVYELLNAKGMFVQKCFFDGGPFFDFSHAVRKIMYKRFSKLVKLFDTDDPKSACDNMMNSGLMKFITKGKTADFEPMIRAITTERRSFSDTTVHGMTEICYHCKLPHFTEGEQRRMIFFHSNEEPAKKSRGRIMKAYPLAIFRGINGYGHCGLQIQKPKAYAGLMKKAMKEWI